MTESGGLISFASQAMLEADPDSVGPPLPTVEVRIVDGGGHDVAEGEVGSICVRSPLVMHGYWRNPDADAAAFLPGRWLRTEDFGRMEGGVLHLASRAGDLVIRGGENVYPAEIEDCLDGHPDVVESAVFGVEDDELGQAVHAAVVTRPGATVTPEALRARCAGPAGRVQGAGAHHRPHRAHSPATPAGRCSSTSWSTIPRPRPRRTRAEPPAVVGGTMTRSTQRGPTPMPGRAWPTGSPTRWPRSRATG